MVLIRQRQARRPVVDLEAMVGLGRRCRPPEERDREDRHDEAAADDRLNELAARLTMLFK